LTDNDVGVNLVFTPIFKNLGMEKNKINVFVDNNLELNINQRIKVSIDTGAFYIGYFKKLPESESEASKKLQEGNVWEFTELNPVDKQPQEPIHIDGETIIGLEKVELFLSKP